jgi:hypothetical protein
MTDQVMQGGGLDLSYTGVLKRENMRLQSQLEGVVQQAQQFQMMSQYNLILIGIIMEKQGITEFSFEEADFDEMTTHPRTINTESTPTGGRKITILPPAQIVEPETPVEESVDV